MEFELDESFNDGQIKLGESFNDGPIKLGESFNVGLLFRYFAFRGSRSLLAATTNLGNGAPAVIFKIIKAKMVETVVHFAWMQSRGSYRVWRDLNGRMALC